MEVQTDDVDTWTLHLSLDVITGVSPAQLGIGSQPEVTRSSHHVGPHFLGESGIFLLWDHFTPGWAAHSVHIMV